MPITYLRDVMSQEVEYLLDNNGDVTSNDSDLMYLVGNSTTPGTEPKVVCSDHVPYSWELFRNQGVTGIVLTSVLWLCWLCIVSIYVDEVVFIIKHFRSRFRKQRTVYILGLPPVYATCAIIGVMVPRSGTLVDLVSNSYFGFAMYCWMSLVGDYLGTEKRAQARGVTNITLATLPCCCFCRCLPTPVFNARTYRRLLVMVYQVTLIRPCIAFISAVLWADGQYIPGKLGNNAFTYLAALNIVSTLVAIWGLVIVQHTFRVPLIQFRIGLKFMMLQLTLLGTLAGNIVIAILVSKGVIPCSEFIPSGARAGRLDNSYLVMWMLLLSLLGRIAFRRKQDGALDTCEERDENGVLNEDPARSNDQFIKVSLDARVDAEAGTPSDMPDDELSALRVERIALDDGVETEDAPCI